MATDVLTSDIHDDSLPVPQRHRRLQSGQQSAFRTLLAPLASLKLTVTLFGLAIFLVFAGTLAQASHDVWWVLHNYFRSPLAWIDFQVFFPRPGSRPGNTSAADFISPAASPSAA